MTTLPTRQGRVVAVSAGAAHRFSKDVVARITLLAGLGVEGDAHCGITVRHRSRVAKDPAQPNLRQVHLIHAALFDELAAKGFIVAPGQLGENITTAGIDLLTLPVNTELQIGATAVIRLTGLRNPCHQLDQFKRGLTAAVLDKTPDGKLIRKAGVMSIVVKGGPVCTGDTITINLPAQPHLALVPV